MSEKLEREKYTKAQVAVGKYVVVPVIYAVAFFRWVKDKAAAIWNKHRRGLICWL